MRAKDFLYFLLSCAGLIIVIQLWQGNRPPEPDPVEKEKVEKKQPTPPKARLTPAQEQVSVAFRALGSPAAALARLALAEKARQDSEISEQARIAKLTPAQKTRRAEAVLMGEAASASLFELKRAEEGPRPKTVSLGADDRTSPYHLFVELSSLSASVVELRLNKFDEGTPEGVAGEGNLVLIPKELYGHATAPSFVLYHYDHPDAQAPRATLEHTVWDVSGPTTDEDGTQHVSFSTVIKSKDVRVTKSFSLEPGTYHLGLAVTLEALGDQPSKFRYQLTGGHGLPIEGRWYTDTFRTALIGYLDEDGDFSRDYQSAQMLRKESKVIEKVKNERMVYAAVIDQYFASVVAVDDEQDDESVDFVDAVLPTLEARVVVVDLEDDLQPGVTKLENRVASEGEAVTFYLKPGLVQAEGQYRKGARLGLLCEFDDEGKLQVLEILPEGETHPVWYDDVTVRVRSSLVEVQKGKPVTHKYLLYNGPVKVAQLKQMASANEKLVRLVEDRYKDKLHLQTLTDYHSPTAIGRFASAIFWSDLIIFFTNLLHGAFAVIYGLIGSNGVSIILLTIMVRMMMFPVSRKQALTGIKMQALAPELKKLKEQYKDDRQQFTAKMMELYRKHGVNPLGSCWMLFLQLPIFMGLYWAFRESVQFRLAPFLWIDNLSAPDMLIPWSKNIPIISRDSSYGGILYLGPYFNVLPLLAIAFMIMQQKMMMPPAQDEQQAAQQKMMRYVMIIFAFVFYKVAAGLCIYFVASSLWGFAERKLLPKKDGKGGKSPLKSTDGVVHSVAESSPNGEKASTFKKGKGKQPARAKDQRPSKASSGSKNSNALAAQGWWGRTRRRVKDWWSELLDKAKKKG